MYMLSINDPLVPWDAAGPPGSARFAGLRTDPMNPRGYVSLSRAPSERWSEELSGVTKGTVRRHKLMSQALSGERTVDIYVTSGFRAGAEITPVLILFDGEESKNLLKGPVILDNLFAQARAKADSEPEWLKTELRSKPRRRVKFYLDVGLMETTGGPLSQVELPRVQRLARFPLLEGGLSGRTPLPAGPVMNAADGQRPTCSK
jgi:hypothetical protein